MLKKFLILAITCLYSMPLCIGSSTYIMENSTPYAYDSQTIFFEMRPGETASRYITFINDLKPASVFFYGTDALVDPSGKTNFKTYKSTQTEVGTWLTTFPKELELKPNEIQNVKMVINVPKDTKPGKYLAGFAIQDTKKTQQGSIIFSIRSVKKIEIQVNNEPKAMPIALPPSLPFNDFYFWTSVIIASLFFASLIAIQLRKRK